jgi:hypothetical protein
VVGAALLSGVPDIWSLANDADFLSRVGVFEASSVIQEAKSPRNLTIDASKLYFTWPD